MWGVAKQLRGLFLRSKNWGIMYLSNPSVSYAATSPYTGEAFFKGPLWGEMRSTPGAWGISIQNAYVCLLTTLFFHSSIVHNIAVYFCNAIPLNSNGGISG